jgi:hypothetical protein
VEVKGSSRGCETDCCTATWVPTATPRRRTARPQHREPSSRRSGPIPARNGDAKACRVIEPRRACRSVETCRAVAGCIAGFSLHLLRPFLPSRSAIRTLSPARGEPPACPGGLPRRGKRRCPAHAARRSPPAHQGRHVAASGAGMRSAGPTAVGFQAPLQRQRGDPEQARRRTASRPVRRHGRPGRGHKGCCDFRGTSRRSGATVRRSGNGARRFL